MDQKVLKTSNITNPMAVSPPGGRFLCVKKRCLNDFGIQAERPIPIPHSLMVAVYVEMWE